MRGIREHLERVRLLLELSKQASDAKTSFRLQLAAVDSCRAIAEIMLEAAAIQQVRALDGTAGVTDRKTLEQEVVSQLPYYYLTERIRIHDFHRFGLVPLSESGELQISMGGPIKLVAQEGTAAVSLTGTGVEAGQDGQLSGEVAAPTCGAERVFPR